MEHTDTTNDVEKKLEKFKQTENGPGNFTLSVAFDKDIETELKRKKELGRVIGYLREIFFPVVSLILERATYGQHELNTIKIDNVEANVADILITRYSTGVYGRVWNDGQIEFSIDHIYSPGLMFHELGHYLYHLGDEYAGCRKNRFEKGKEGDPASIMEYSFGNNTRFKSKDKDWEYKVLEGGGFYQFFEDLENGLCELKYEDRKVVTDFCTDSIGANENLKHNPVPESEQNVVNNKQSCWSVMLDDTAGGIKVRKNYQYNFKDPFADKFNIDGHFRTRNVIEQNLMTFEKELETLIQQLFSSEN